MFETILCACVIMMFIVCICYADWVAEKINSDGDTK